MSQRDESLLIVCTDTLLREATQRFIERITSWKTLIVAATPAQAMIAMTRESPAAVLFLGDLRNPSAPALAREISRRWAGTRVLVARNLAPRPELLDELLLLLLSAGEETPADDTRAPAVALLARLTRRERVVLALLAQGLRPQEVAEQLDLSPHTIRTYMQSLYKKWDAQAEWSCSALVSTKASPGRHPAAAHDVPL